MTNKLKEQEWQKVFLETGTENGFGDLSMLISTVSNIIQSKLASQREEIRGKLEGKKKTCKHKGMPYSVERECHERQIKGYNEGISAALSILQEMEELK